MSNGDNIELKATFHLTISMRGQRATVKMQRNNYHHGNCIPSLLGKTMSVFLIFMQATHRNVKNRWVRSSLKAEPDVKACPHDAISCTQPLSNLLISTS